MKKSTKKNLLKQVEQPLEKSIYEGLVPPTKKIAGRAVIIATNGETFVLPDKSAIGQFPAIPIAETIESLEAFLDAPAALVNAHHERVFKSLPDKHTDKTLAAMMVWAYYVRNAKPLIPAVINESGEKPRTERKNVAYSTRLYFLGSVPISEDLPPQARTCYAILADSLGVEKGDEGSGRVTEAELRKAVEARAAELKTKQDPWRIFQYYRPRLLAEKMIRHD